jgi:hypothetical protein
VSAKQIRWIFNALGFTVGAVSWRWPERAPEPPYNWRSIRDWRP